MGGRGYGGRNLRKAEVVDPKVLVSSGFGLVCFIHPAPAATLLWIPGSCVLFLLSC